MKLRAISDFTNTLYAYRPFGHNRSSRSYKLALQKCGMLPEDEWDKRPDIVSVLKPMIMEHLDGVRDGYTAKRIIEDMMLLEHELFREMEPIDVLDSVKVTLRKLEEDGDLQSKRVRMGYFAQWFYRPVRRNPD